MTGLNAGSLLQPLLDASELNRLPWEEDPTGGYLVLLGDNKGVDFVDYDATRSDFDQARQLHDTARRQVLGADKVLEDILGRLTVAS